MPTKNQIRFAEALSAGLDREVGLDEIGPLVDHRPGENDDEPDQRQQPAQ